MNTKNFEEAMGMLEDRYIEKAIAYQAKKRSSMWLKWGAIAACFCLACVLGAIGGSFLGDYQPDPVVDQVAYGFMLSEDSSDIYFPIGFSERKVYGLVDEDAKGLTEENKYRITEKDLGELMGTVYACEDQALVGCKVYHFAKYPETESICIIEGPGGYEFYTKITIKD